jgi:hypothetical protein
VLPDQLVDHQEQLDLQVVQDHSAVLLDQPVPWEAQACRDARECLEAQDMDCQEQPELLVFRADQERLVHPVARVLAEQRVQSDHREYPGQPVDHPALREPRVLAVRLLALLGQTVSRVLQVCQEVPELWEALDSDRLDRWELQALLGHLGHRPLEPWLRFLDRGHVAGSEEA